MSAAPAAAWIAFGVLVAVLLAIDLFAHRCVGHDSPRRALAWSAGWIAVAVVFGAGVGATLGAGAAEEFFSAYLLEKSLSVDNLFVFLIVFQTFRIPKEHERRILTWGVIGALVSRAVFIALGASLLARFGFVLDVFAAVLVVTAVKMLRAPAEPKAGGRLERLLRRLPYTESTRGGRFVVREGGRAVATPLLLALLAIELTDIVFAVDSVPAAFAITREPFIIYTSNVFATLGLRSLYVVLARTLEKLRYLRFGLAAVLLLAAAKMVAAHWVHVPPILALGAIAACLGASIVASLAAGAGGSAPTDGASAPIPSIGQAGGLASEEAPPVPEPVRAQ